MQGPVDGLEIVEFGTGRQAAAIVEPRHEQPIHRQPQSQAGGDHGGEGGP